MENKSSPSSLSDAWIRCVQTKMVRRIGRSGGAGSVPVCYPFSLVSKYVLHNFCIKRWRTRKSFGSERMLIFTRLTGKWPWSFLGFQFKCKFSDLITISTIWTWRRQCQWVDHHNVCPGELMSGQDSTRGDCNEFHLQSEKMWNSREFAISLKICRNIQIFRNNLNSSNWGHS